MARPRTTYALATLVAMGAGYLFFVERRLPTPEQRRLAGRRVFNFASDEVERLAIRRDAWTSGVVERTGSSAFHVVEPRQAAVDATELASLLSRLEFLEHDALLEGDAGDAGRLADYGLAPAGLQIELGLTGGRVVRFEIGKPAGVGGGLYLHVADENRVQVVDGSLRQPFDVLLEHMSTPRADDETSR